MSETTYEGTVDDPMAAANEALKRMAANLPADATPEERACFSHPAVISHVAAMIACPDLVQPVGFQMLVRVYEEQQERERYKEQVRPRLRTANPPKGNVSAGKQSVVFGFVALMFLLAALMCFLYPVIPPAIACTVAGIAFGASSAYKIVKGLENLKQWPLIFRTIVFDPPLKNGKAVTLPSECVPHNR